MADYTIVNVVALLVGLLFVGTGVHLVRTGRESVAAFLLTTAVGFGLVFVALFPGAFDLVARVLGLELRARAILVISNLTLFVLVTYLLNRIGRLSDRVSRLNERLSLLDRELEDRTFEDREIADRGRETHESEDREFEDRTDE